MSGLDIALIGGAVLAYALWSRRLAGTPITAPMVFVTVGFIIGPRALDLLEIDVGSSGGGDPR